MSRILIVYASHYGQTRLIAERIRDRLRERGHHVDLANAVDASAQLPRPRAYDAVVLGSRIEFGKHAPALLDYIRGHRAGLESVPTAFFSVSMSAAGKEPDSDPNDYLATTFAQLGWMPTERAVFGGALQYRRYNWLLRLVMRELSRRGGHSTDTSKNHYYTNIAAVTDFADRFAWHLDERHSAVHA